MRSRSQRLVPRPTQLSVLISWKFETVHGLVRRNYPYGHDLDCSRRLMPMHAFRLALLMVGECRPFWQRAKFREAAPTRRAGEERTPAKRVLALGVLLPLPEARPIRGRARLNTRSAPSCRVRCASRPTQAEGRAPEPCGPRGSPSPAREVPSVLTIVPFPSAPGRRDPAAQSDPERHDLVSFT
jgi:hypothetical protein